MKANWQKLVLAVMAFLGAMLLQGCAAPDSENASSRPWNSPTGWEHGLPTGLNDGR